MGKREAEATAAGMAEIEAILKKHGVELPSKAKGGAKPKRDETESGRVIDKIVRVLTESVRDKLPNMVAVAPEDFRDGCGDPTCKNCAPSQTRRRFAWFHNAMARLRVGLMIWLYGRLQPGEQAFLGTEFLKAFMPEEWGRYVTAHIRLNEIIGKNGPVIGVAALEGFALFDVEGATAQAEREGMDSEAEFLRNVAKLRDRVIEEFMEDARKTRH